MSPDREGRRDDGRNFEEYEGDSPRSIFSALWFRALLAVLVLGVIAAVAVPYILDYATHQTGKSPASKARATPPTESTSTPAVAPAPATATAPATTAQAPAPPAAAAPAPESAPATAPATASAPTEPVAPATPPPSAAKPAPAAKSGAAKSAAPAAKPKTAAMAKAEAREGKAPGSRPGGPTTVAAASADGTYWVQVGAFKDAETAKRILTRLREQGFPVAQSTTTISKPGTPAASPSGAALSLPPQTPGDRYHVIVSGATSADVDAKLAAKGMTSEATSGGVMVQPSLPLRDAVALSRDLADAGLTVQVRRASGSGSTPAPPPSPAAAEATAPTKETLHRVRVGAFAERAAAVATLKQLEEKGFKPYIARGNE